MQVLASSPRPGDGPLWLTAFGLSLLANAAILVTVGFATLESARLRAKSVPTPAPSAPSVVLIFPEEEAPGATPASTAARQEPDGVAANAVAPAYLPATGPRFARTSEDQLAARPDTPAFLGERNTQATSDRAPDPQAPALPSQAGIAPHDAMDIETTASDYQDGRLDAGARGAGVREAAPTAAQTAPADPAMDPADPAAAAMDPAAADPAPATPPEREKLLDGPLPVDVPVPHELARNDELPPPPARRQGADPTPAPAAESLPPAAHIKTATAREPGFRGFQRKTVVTGSITRSGRSALDVEDSPLGRYQATLSRAVELEWQRNCVRHRDFITPGFLTVRFFVEPGGKVRSVQFVGDMETGEVQKGFTLNSIRDAAIPAMPAVLRQQYDKEPLELIFRFYF